MLSIIYLFYGLFALLLNMAILVSAWLYYNNDMVHREQSSDVRIQNDPGTVSNEN